MTAATRRLSPVAVFGALFFLLGDHRDGDRAWGDEPSVRTDRFGAPLPKDALLRLGVTRFGVEGFVAAVAFSPDGKWLAGSDFYGSVYLWEAVSGKRVRQLEAGEDSVSIFFSRDGKSLGARNTKGEVYLWDVVSGRLQASFRRHATEKYHEQLLLSPDRTRAIVVGDANRLINVRNGKPADSYVIGKKLPELAIELLELPSGKVVKQLARNAPDTLFSDSALSPDGKLLAVGIRAYKAPRKLLRLLDATNGKVMREISREGEGWFLSVAFSHDGKTLALGSKDEIALVDVASGKLVGRLTDSMSTVGFVGFSSVAGILVSHSHDHKVRLWDLPASKVVRQFAAPAEGHFVFPHSLADRSEIYSKANTPVNHAPVVIDKMTTRNDKKGQRAKQAARAALSSGLGGQVRVHIFDGKGHDLNPIHRGAVTWNPKQHRG